MRRRLSRETWVGAESPPVLWATSKWTPSRRRCSLSPLSFTLHALLTVALQDCCVLRCTFEHTQALSAPVHRDFAFDLFDNRDYADLVFRIKSNAAEAPSHLFALKLLLQKRSPYLKTRSFSFLFGFILSFPSTFSPCFLPAVIASGFEESSSFINLDPSTCGQTSTPLIGDGTDFAAFEAALLPPAKTPPPAQRGKPAGPPSLAAATSPHKKRKIGHLIFPLAEEASSTARGGAPSPEGDEKIEVEGRDTGGEDTEVKDAVQEEEDNEEEEDAKEEDEELQSAGGASAVEDEAEEQEEGGRSFQVIDISGRRCGRCFPFLLAPKLTSLPQLRHLPRPHLLPPHWHDQLPLSVSDYLVDQHAELEKNKDHNVEPRNSWLVKKSFRKDPPPCNPHALYRLADEHLDDKLRDLAKGFICRSLTIENVCFPPSPLLLLPHG